MAIRTCIFCDAVHDANDFDEDWDVTGCPECDRGTMIDMKLWICSGKDSCNRKDCEHAKPHKERDSCHAPCCDYAHIVAECKPVEVD